MFQTAKENHWSLTISSVIWRYLSSHRIRFQSDLLQNILFLETVEKVMLVSNRKFIIFQKSVISFNIFFFFFFVFSPFNQNEYDFMGISHLNCYLVIGCHKHLLLQLSSHSGVNQSSNKFNISLALYLKRLEIT